MIYKLTTRLLRTFTFFNDWQTADSQYTDWMRWRILPTQIILSTEDRESHRHLLDFILQFSLQYFVRFRIVQKYLTNPPAKYWISTSLSVALQTL